MNISKLKELIDLLQWSRCGGFKDVLTPEISWFAVWWSWLVMMDPQIEPRVSSRIALGGNFPGLMGQETKLSECLKQEKKIAKWVRLKHGIQPTSTNHIHRDLISLSNQFWSPWPCGDITPDHFGPLKNASSVGRSQLGIRMPLIDFWKEKWYT